MGRPSNFAVLSDLAVAMWEPVFRQLTEEDLEKLNSIPYDEALYAREAEAGAKILSTFTVKKQDAPVGHECEWLTADQVIDVHDRMIDAYGGHPGVRIHNAVPAYLDRAMNSKMYGEDPYPTVFEKAAYVFRSICAEHPFVDGQKRTGLATAFILLGLNGYALWSRHQMDEVHYAIHVAQGKMEVEEIAKWLQARVGPLEIGKGNSSVVSMLGGPSGASTQPRCRECGRFLTQSGRYALCLGSCKRAYQVTARAIGFAAGRDKKHIEARIGLHKVGDSVKVEQRGENRVATFRITARDEYERMAELIKGNPTNKGIVPPPIRDLRVALVLPK